MIVVLLMMYWTLSSWDKSPQYVWFLITVYSFSLLISGYGGSSHALLACLLSRFSHVWLFATLWTVTYQAPLSMEFSRQVYWSGLPFPSAGNLPDPGREPRSPALKADSLSSEPPGKLKEGFHLQLKMKENVRGRDLGFWRGGKQFTWS